VARPGRGRGAQARDGLVVVGASDGVDHLDLVEVLGAVDRRHEPDEHSVAHHLGLEPGSAVGVPDRLAPVAKAHSHAELVHAFLGRACVDAAFPQGVNHATCPVLVHDRPTYRSVSGSIGQDCLS